MRHLRYAILALLVVEATTASAEERRIYHNETLTSIATSRHTHVRVTGEVTLVRREADGDIHIRVRDNEDHFVVAEIVPYHAIQAPHVGQVITVEGIRRFDNEAGHGWWEVHPVEQWRAQR